MKLKEIVKKTNWQDVRECLLSIYPEYKKSIKGFEVVYQQLRTKKAGFSKIELRFERHESDNSIEVYGIDGTLRDDGQLERFGISLSPWSKWLSSSLSEETLAKYSNEEIISYCLFDMTFYGFTESKINDFSNELKRRTDDSKDPTRYIIISDIFKSKKNLFYFTVSDDAWCSDIDSATAFKREAHARLILKSMDRKKNDYHHVAKITTKNGKRKIVKNEKL